MGEPQKGVNGMIIMASAENENGALRARFSRRVLGPEANGGKRSEWGQPQVATMPAPKARLFLVPAVLVCPSSAHKRLAEDPDDLDHRITIRLSATLLALNAA